MKVLIADDHPIFRKGLADIIANKLIHSEVLEASNGSEAIELFNELNIDVAILDIEMPGEDGLKVCRNIKKQSISTKVVILTMYKHEDIFNMSIAAGADGFVLKDNSAKDVIECIESVLQGKEYISPEMYRYLQNRGSFRQRKKQLTGGLQELTKTEAKVLTMVGQNLNSSEIAEKLFVTRKSVENYRSRICKKLGLEGSNNALIKWVLENQTLLKLIENDGMY